MLHVVAQVASNRNGAKFLFPLSLGFRRFRGIAVQWSIVRGDQRFDWRKRASGNKYSCKQGNAMDSVHCGSLTRRELFPEQLRTASAVLLGALASCGRVRGFRRSVRVRRCRVLRKPGKYFVDNFVGPLGDVDYNRIARLFQGGKLIVQNSGAGEMSVPLLQSLLNQLA